MKKKDYTEEFLIEFRKIEQLVKQVYGPNTTFRDVEQMMEDKGESSIAKKMQICRIVRNYASHDNDLNTFLPVSEETCNFMRDLYKMINNEISTAKDEMSRIKPLDVKDNLIQASKRLLKLPAIPVVDKNGVVIGVFDSDVLKKSVAGELSLKTNFSKGLVKLTSLSSSICLIQSTPMTIVEDVFRQENTNIVYVTSDGTSKGKFIGVITK